MRKFLLPCGRMRSKWINIFSGQTSSWNISSSFFCYSSFISRFGPENNNKVIPCPVPKIQCCLIWMKPNCIQFRMDLNIWIDLALSRQNWSPWCQALRYKHIQTVYLMHTVLLCSSMHAMSPFRFVFKYIIVLERYL